MEELSPNQLAFQIEKRLADLQKILAAKKKSYEKAPQGRIRISQNGGHPEYYLVTDGRPCGKEKSFGRKPAPPSQTSRQGPA